MVLALTQLLDVILLALNFDVHTDGRGKDRANNLSLLRKTDSAGQPIEPSIIMMLQ